MVLVYEGNCVDLEVIVMFVSACDRMKTSVMHLSLAVTLPPRHASNPYKLRFIDIKRAYFHAKCIRDVYVDLPARDYQEGMCGKLNMAMYGTRDAPQNWEFEYAEFMEGNGFNKGKATPCLFYHEARNIRVVVYGDDFTVLGLEEKP